MFEITACPQCSRQLAIPDEAAEDASLACPECGEIFAARERAEVAAAIVVQPEVSDLDPDATAGLPRDESDTIALTDPPTLQVGSQSENGNANTLDSWLFRDRPSGNADETVDEPPAAKPAAEQVKPPRRTLASFTSELSESEGSEQPSSDEPTPARRQDAPASSSSLESLLASFRQDATVNLGSDATLPLPSLEKSLSAQEDAPESNHRQDEPEATESTPAAESLDRSSIFQSPFDREPGKTAQQPPASEPSEQEEFTPAAFTAPASMTTEPAEEHRVDQPTAEPRHEGAASAREPLSRDFSIDLESPLEDPRREQQTPLGPPPHEAKPRGRRRRRVLLQSTAIVMGGALGLALGYAGLVLVKGPSGDVLGLARRLPESMRPAAFASDTLASTQHEAPATAPETISDPLVQPATFEEADADAQPADAPPSPVDFNSGVLAGGLSGGDPHPEGAPSYSVDDLRTALDGADAARVVLSENDLAENPGAAREMGGAFAKLCQLANVLTFVEDEKADRDLTLLEAKEVFHRLFQYQHARRDARDMAARWLAWPDRAHGGVVLAGKLISAQKLGSVHAYYLQMSDGSKVEAITAAHIDAERFTGAQEMGIVGWIVDSPQDHIPGYAGNAEQAIWVGHSIALREPKFP